MFSYSWLPSRYTYGVEGENFISTFRRIQANINNNVYLPPSLVEEAEVKAIYNKKCLKEVSQHGKVSEIEKLLCDRELTSTLKTKMEQRPYFTLHLAGKSRM